MARKYHTNVTEVKAVEYVVTVYGLDEYKDAWLTICNNAREYPDSILKVSNNSSSDIFVLCPATANSDCLTKSWLEQFGDVKVYEDKIAVMVDIDCEYTKSFDEDYVDSEYVLGETD